ncbi:Squalene epoxidase [Yamadazyma tenuis]|uniref:Squalene monooxygenase n=1 Tax=Candida tenuis (strain ATCC 10573 / BCRC 21748 / CBS 615 / JCM 9827 / NBRC 10315 / NRRL Y-1498 / VKM Y-70) TaxID=590646 RepID=G3B373_CANTC|nr:squalene epoxidase, erosterol biosynthesis [Yamadazyma tenuis ATCC 10573]EGV64096.1 squalene epoxidase, erosterol biosynthesis [Yamadazyma tenuis ATCC 10573]WEJ96269.1 Squalene epoxidase [Yamadazyma tenuis]
MSFANSNVATDSLPNSVEDKQYDAVVVGAGVAGPAIATAFARAGRQVLLIERSWSRPDRIVGELMQPAGVKALCELGLAQAVANIEAMTCEGYYIKYHDRVVQLSYLDKAEAATGNPIKPVPDCVFDDNDKLITDSTLSSKDWYDHPTVQGLAFHNGDFLMNLRAIARAEPNVTCLEATVTGVVRDDNDVVVGVRVKAEDVPAVYRAKLVVACDGIYSKLRRELPAPAPSVESYFVGLDLHDCDFPAPGHGHVILGDHAPVLAYQTTPTTARMLCAWRSTKPPSSSGGEFANYLNQQVRSELPKEIQPSFDAAVASKRFRPMPNQYLPAVKQSRQRGFVAVGDSLNMRHPLTGGGMTVALNDVVILAKLLHPSQVADLGDHEAVLRQMAVFHRRRKPLDAVINTLSMALYALFAADSPSLRILQRGCFRYFELGGACVSGPIGLLSGMLPFPMMLFNHFFSVAFYAIWWNFTDNGLLYAPVSVYQSVVVLVVAVRVFVPILWAELAR